MRKDEIVQFPIMLKELEGMMLSKISHRMKGKYWMFSLVCVNIDKQNKGIVWNGDKFSGLELQNQLTSGERMCEEE